MKYANKFLLIYVIINLLVSNIKTYGTIYNTCYPQDSDSTYMISPTYPASYKGGNKQLNKFITDHISFPKTTNDLSLKLFVEFIIEKNGTLSNIQLLQSTNHELADELIRVLKLTNEWVSGVFEYKKNKTVERTLYTLPVNFSSNKITVPDLFKQTIQDSIDNKMIFASNLETLPSFPGGDKEFGKFLKDNIRYPRSAKEKNVTGRVFIQFVIEANGSLTHLQVLRDPGSGLGDETMRVFKMCPNFEPGKINNTPVRVLYVSPVNFSLSK